MVGDGFEARPAIGERTYPYAVAPECSGASNSCRVAGPFETSMDLR